jgi:hypothetical protein
MYSFVKGIYLCYFQVGDFGLSIFDNASKADGGVTGTAAYLAPETLEGVPFTIRADVTLSFLLFTTLFVLSPPRHSHP